MNKLFLLDAYALIYRSFYAMRNSPIRNSSGLNTSPVYGFTATLHDVMTRERPTHMAVCFDPAGPTFRHEAYPEYKAQREATPEDIHLAVPIVKRLLKAFRITAVEAPGFEADDVVGTLARRFASDDTDVYMLTPDKDYAQLVTPHALLYRPHHQQAGYDIMGPAEVCQHWQVADPGQIIDLLALVGDKADNVPGCRGIGDKGAAALIAKFGSVEELVARAAELTPRQRTAIEQGAESIRFSKYLVTIRTDVPLDLRLDDLELREPDYDDLDAQLRKLEFRQLRTRILKERKQTPISDNREPDLFSEFANNGAAAPEKAVLQSHEADKADYKLVDTEEDIRKLCSELLTKPLFSLDTETTSTDSVRAELVGMSFAAEEGAAWYVPVPADETEARARVALLRPAIESETAVKVGQNIKYDYEMLLRYGARIGGQMWDTMIAHYLLQPEQPHNMDYLAEALLGYRTIPIEELIGPRGKGQKSMRDVPPETVCPYAAEDADITLRLYRRLKPMIDEAGAARLFYDVEMPLVRVLADMELEGVTIDTESLKETSREFGRRMADIERQIYGLAGGEFNISSPRQVGTVLFDKLHVSDKPKKTKTGQYVTSEETLQSLSPRHPIVGLILAHRALKKLLSTYVDALPKLINPATGRIHTSFNQAVTATGRLSSSEPNLQNIPVRGDDGKEIRRAFTAASGCRFFSADYSQIELRVLAHLSGDEGLIAAFRAGDDIHAATAAHIYKKPIEDVTRDERTRAKRANFGIVYGITVFGLAEQLGISRDEARSLIDGYFGSFPRVAAYIEEQKERVRQTGYAETLYGRRRYLPDILSRNATMRNFAERNAVNAPIQGTAADIIKRAMVGVHRRFAAENLRSKMILQVHDELNFSVCPGEEEAVERIVKEEMEGAALLSVPLIADSGWGDNWLEAH